MFVLTKFCPAEPQQNKPLPLAATEMPQEACAPDDMEAKPTGEGTTPGSSIPAALVRPHCPYWQ